MPLKISTAKWRPYCRRGDELNATPSTNTVMASSGHIHTGLTFEGVNVPLYPPHPVTTNLLLRLTKVFSVVCKHAPNSEVKSPLCGIVVNLVRSTLCVMIHWPLHYDALQWRHNGRYRVSNHQPYDCLLNRLFRRRSMKASKLRVIGLCVGNSPVTDEFPAQMASNAENVSIWWRHHVYNYNWYHWPVLVFRNGELHLTYIIPMLRNDTQSIYIFTYIHSCHAPKGKE